MRTLPVIITPLAQSDIEAISDYIAQDNPAKARAFARELIDKCQSLSKNPARYPLAERLPGNRVRKATHGNYLIFYLVYPDGVSIARVLHGATDYEAKLGAS
nr:type II toxin-antitoxin system RelE/ParE family toxin [Novosphingobium sp. AAP93]